jgi:LysM repeat protein
MEHLRPRPQQRRTVSRRVHRLVTTVWIIASLALPALGVLVITSEAIVPVDETATSYTVRAGDTLSAIALRYGVTVEAIMQANGLSNANLIYAGQVLTLPRVDTATGEQTYTVQRGDYLSVIARRYGVTLEELTAANGLANPNLISEGQVLTIPGSTIVETAVVEVETETNYRLQRGDSLYRVSLIYGVSVDDLLAANDLASPNSIYPGLEIRIPNIERSLAENTADTETGAASSTGGRMYTVQYGDTLTKIAINNNVTVDGIVAANGLSSSDSIYAGQTLSLPEEGASARPYPAQAATTHTVTAGETLSQIAMKYGVTLNTLATANGISNTSMIYVGMVLSIPSAQAGSNSVTYASVGEGLCTGANPERSGTGYFIRPVRGYTITQYFHPWHPGIDLALPVGEPVYAADGGTVVYAGWNPVGYGNLIVLDHGNGWRTYYAHLSAIDVGCDGWIPRGSIIGEIGSTGNSTGPHLHFEMLRFGIAVDPTGYIRF